MSTLLQVQQLSCTAENGLVLFGNVEFVVNEGDVVVVTGKSGSGKSTLLKSLAHFNLYSGHVLYRGRAPTSYGIPEYRTKVAYVPQRPSLLPGTPRSFLRTVSSFKARQKHKGPIVDAPINVAQSWGIDPQLWDREWSNLSGGEVQRISLATGLALNDAEVLLLDEPTSALDRESCLLVERFILDNLKSPETDLKAIVWITHSVEQAERVGTRFLQVSGGSCSEDQSLPV
ncbi:hypothetical protein D9758_003332 [Tetrapyrgos nigripes]|uniref:ABC transporter domain-containing protein n=1 Tax=Tetrapyrgos nigripes TaxID=182062 RepID=A0A8H5LPX1_9AGAR|nr:hypothetical protein D9758_003332 [Tetrapyrgos nigripes]